MKIFQVILLLFLTTTLTQASGAVAFVYHRFGEPKYSSTNITLKQFQIQLDYLQKHQYNIWRLSKIIEHLQTQKPIPPKTVAITMDDAYKSVYTNAYPMLKEKGFPFTVFVNTQPIDRGSKNYVTWEQMRHMQKDGAEFFNHSLSHNYLLVKNGEILKEANERITKQITKAQQRLDKELGSQKLKLLAYPYGEYDANTKKILQDLDFIGISQTSGPMGPYSDMYAISRFPMAEMFASMRGFETKLNTTQLPITSVSPQTHRLHNSNPPKLTIELQHPLKQISCFTSNGERIKMVWISDTVFEVSASKPLAGEREKYTCTAPAKEGKWYWYSHLFIVAKR